MITKGKRIASVISGILTIILLVTAAVFYKTVKSYEITVADLEKQIEDANNELLKVQNSLSATKTSLSNTKTSLLNTEKALESANATIKEQIKLTEKYLNEAETWKNKALENASDQSNTSETFTDVASLLYAIKRNSAHYDGKRVTVTGTVAKIDELLLIDCSNVSDLKSMTSGVAYRAWLKDVANIEATLNNKLKNTYMETGDLAIVSGKINVTNDNITLHIDDYKLITLCEER